ARPSRVAQQSRRVRPAETDDAGWLSQCHACATPKPKWTPRAVDRFSAGRPDEIDPASDIATLFQALERSRNERRLPMPTATAAPKTVAAKPLRLPNGDFYELVELLTPEEKAVVKKVRVYMETKVRPIINKYWADD